LGREADHHLAPMLRMSGAMPQLPPYVFTACTGASWPFCSYSKDFLCLSCSIFAWAYLNRSHCKDTARWWSSCSCKYRTECTQHLLITYLLTCLLTYLFHWAKSFL